MKSTRFHHEICQISPWNPPDFMVYHWMLYFSSEPIQIYIMSLLHVTYAVYKSLPWNLLDFMHEICWISWNSPDFMKSAGFHHEIHQISWYTTECCIFHQNQYRYTLWAYYMLNMQCISPCHEICRISWNPPDFTMKSAGFHHEIQQISWQGLIHCICNMKSAGFHHEIRNP